MPHVANTSTVVASGLQVSLHQYEVTTIVPATALSPQYERKTIHNADGDVLNIFANEVDGEEDDRMSVRILSFEVRDDWGFEDGYNRVTTLDTIGNLLSVDCREKAEVAEIPVPKVNHSMNPANPLAVRTGWLRVAMIVAIVLIVAIASIAAAH